MEAAENNIVKKKLNSVIHFQVTLSDEKGATPERIILNAKVDSTKEEISSRKPDLVVKTTLSVLQDLLDQKYSPQQAFLKRKIQIQGKMALAMKLTLILKETRKLLSHNSSKL